MTMLHFKFLEVSTKIEAILRRRLLTRYVILQILFKEDVEDLAVDLKAQFDTVTYEFFRDLLII